jgi:hypothetical protein
MSSAVCSRTAKETRVVRLCYWEGKLAIWIESLPCLDTRYRQSARHKAKPHGIEDAHGKALRLTAKKSTRQTTPGARQSNYPQQIAHGSSVDRGHTAKHGTRQRQQELTAKCVLTADCHWGQSRFPFATRATFVALLRRASAGSIRRTLRRAVLDLLTA